MASSINVNQNNNTVSLQDQNRKITITDNVQEKTVNVTQPVTDIVNVVTIGPQGPSGASGPSGSQGPAGSSQDTGSLLTTASYSNPNLTFTKGDGNTFNVEISTTTPSLSQVMAQGKSTNFAITSSADISSSGNVIMDGARVFGTAIVNSHITASGNISSSGDLYGKNIILPDTSKIGWDAANAANNINLTGKGGILTIFSGSTSQPASVPKIQIDASNANLTSSGNITANIISASRFEGGGIDGRDDRVNFTAPLTASIISASGNIIGNSLTLAGNITASGNISSSGTITGNSIVGTLGTAAQTNITSLGTLTALTVDNLNLDSNALSSTLDTDVFMNLGTAGFDFEANAGDKFLFNSSNQNNVDFQVSGENDLNLIYADASTDNVGIGDATPTAKLDVAGNINTTSHITASGNISASGTVVGSNVTTTNATDITSLKAQQNILYKLTGSSDIGTTQFASGLANVASNNYVSSFFYISLNTSSLNGVNIARGKTTSTLDFKDVGSSITLTSTSSGKFIRANVLTYGTPIGATVKYICSRVSIITSSAGAPDADDVVEFKWDNSAGVGTIQGTGVNNFDTTINKIDIIYRSSSANYLPAAGFGDESPVPLTSAVYAMPFISKSADLTINSLTTVGNVSSSAGTGSFGYILLPNLPTSDPGVAGAVFRSGNDLKISTG